MKRRIERIGSILLMVLLLGAVAGCTKAARTSRMLQAANRDFNDEKYDEAEVEYKNVRHVQAMNPTAIGQLGILYLKEGRLMEAYPFLQKAVELEPDKLSVQLSFAQVCSAFHRYTNAWQVAVRILNAQPTNEEALILLAEMPFSPRQIRQQLEELPRVEANPAYHLVQGMVALREQNLTGAENELNLALAANPNSSEAYYGLADLYTLQKKMTAAAAALEKASDLSPIRSPLRSRYIDYLFQTGQVDKGRKLAEEVIEKAPDYMPGWIGVMNMSLSQKRYDDAAKYANAILARDERNYEGLMGLGQVALAKSDTAQAILQFERLEALYKKSPQVKYELGSAYLSTHDKVKGMSYLNQALALDPTYRLAILLSGEMDIRNGDAVSAVKLLSHYLQKVPSDGQAALLLAQAYLAQQKTDSAIAVYKKMSEALPKNPQIPMLMGMVLAQQHRNADARAAFEKTLSLSPGYLQGAEQLIDLDISEHKYAAAADEAQTQITKNPTAAEPWELLAKIDVAQTNLAKAETALLKAIEINPNLPNPYLLLAEVYVNSGKEQDALKKLGTLVERTNDAPAFLQIGAIHEKLKQFDQARDAYEKVLTINPKSSPALNNLGYIYAVRLNNLDRAYDLAQKARELLPYNANVADTLGWVLFKKGDYSRALSLLEEGTELSPGDGEIQFHLGMTHYMMDEEGLARVALQRAVVSTQDFPNKDEATNHLALLDMDVSGANESRLATLRQALKDHPDDPVLLNRIGSLEERQGAFDQAAESYEAALKQNPDAVPILAKLARLYALRLNQPDKAMSLASTAHKLAPDNPAVAAILGHLVFQSGDYAWSLSLLENAAPQLPDDPDLLHDLAWAYYAVGRVGDARSTMQKALDLGSEFAGVADAKQFMTMASAYDSAAKFQAAAPVAEKILQKEPNNVPALMVSGAAQETAADFKTAQQTYAKALAAMPTFVPAARQLAILDAGHFPDDPQGYTCAEKARSAYPEDAAVARSLGILSYYQAKYPRSEEVLQETVDKNRKDGEAYYYLGMDLFQSKRTRESKQALEKALALKIPEQLASTAKQTLAELK